MLVAQSMGRKRSHRHKTIWIYSQNYLALRRQRQGELYEFKASVVYIVSSRPFYVVTLTQKKKKVTCPKLLVQFINLLGRHGKQKMASHSILVR